MLKLFLKILSLLPGTTPAEPPIDLEYRRWLASLKKGDPVICRMGQLLVPERGTVVRSEQGVLLVNFSGRTHCFVGGALVGYTYKLEPYENRQSEDRQLEV